MLQDAFNVFETYIPLKSERRCKQQQKSNHGIFSCLNPFEVREVLQAIRTVGGMLAGSQSLWSQGGAARYKMKIVTKVNSLNPFEVREVLQANRRRQCFGTLVSIPLKSGRCCKLPTEPKASEEESQSLWSQGGAARLHVTLLRLL